ncbi:colicin D domain-containing protein [Bacillus arachidis]|uniref:Colicin D C-terminal domain-containing protein n=1 Tax=Bacillus arachidis TaxID=2819290 RepID=A0ABS3P2X7_9BACI|nr:colicin D domain-containing protein [Bacillus arachidis]MBO1627445.1 hypothetical protein [Bacillus arachidis]
MVVEADKAFRYGMKKMGEYVPKSGRGLAFETQSAGKVPSGGKNLLQDAYQYMKETGEKVFGSEVMKLPDTTFTTKKLQHEYKHAKDFGVTGNWNKVAAETYQKAIQNHIDTANDVYKSTYRGQEVYVHINRNNEVGAYTDLSGNYIGGWKFNSNQMNFHLTNGTKIK